MKKSLLALMLALCICLCSCTPSGEQSSTAPDAAEQTNHQEDTTMPKLSITIGEQTFAATLEDNETARALLESLPMTISMSELNGNEKYYYMDSRLPTDAHRPGSIQAGDLMLFGSECLVLFYESFSSTYSYTRLGRVDEPAGLAAALGRGSAEVSFELA